jgi:ribosome biogenesis GTPase A
MRLAFIGSINDEIIIMEEMACDLIKVMKELYPEALKERYNLAEIESPVSVLEGIAENRKCYSKGEELDLVKAANMLIDDFRSGKLGRITLERP